MNDGQPESAEPAPATIRRIATICNQRGLHARASAALCQDGGRVRAPTSGCAKNGTVGVRPLDHGPDDAGRRPGTVVELPASGPQAEAAVAALADLIECKFNED